MLFVRHVSCVFYRIVEKGYYSERDAADAVKQILEAVAVSVLFYRNNILLLLKLLVKRGEKESLCCLC